MTRQGVPPTIELLYGDCRTLLPSLPSAKYSLCVTDPPYRIQNWEHFGLKANRNYGDAPEPPTYESWIPEVKRLLEGNGQLIIFETPKNVQPLINVLTRYQFEVMTVGFWRVLNRSTGIAGPFYRNKIDVWVWAVKNRPYYFDFHTGADMDGGVMSEVWEECYVRATHGVFGAKPLRLIMRMIAVHSKPESWVLDPFLGSGTAALAAQELGRSFTGIEFRENLKALHRRALKLDIKRFW